MKLWLVEGSSWGVQVDVVRAATAEDAIRVAGNRYPNATATELMPKGDEQVLYSYENSPDTG